MEAMVVVFAALAAAPTGPLTAADLDRLEAEKSAAGWTFTIGRNPATERPVHELCGLVVPKDWRTRAPFRRFAAKEDLPAQFDWRALNGCTPIRNQANCGSCWAFATVGVFECNILIRDGAGVDLSEQWLVSCNQEEAPPELLGGGWGCGGGWWAHDYFSGARTDPCGGAGAVPEIDFPYKAADRPCDCPYPHAYAIDSWAYIGNDESIADTAAIKQAILEYGPVCAAVYVNSAFRAYTGGVFNASEVQEVNHAAVLVGWDDNQGTNGVWILRNSWTSGWGENGYMLIEYGCSNVGFAANCVDYAGYGLGIGPAAVIRPENPTVPAGWHCRLWVEASGLGDLHYQWRRNGIRVNGDEPILLFASAGPEDEGTYTCEVSDIRGSTLSAGVYLDVDAGQPVPAAGAGALSVLAGMVLIRFVIREGK